MWPMCNKGITQFYLPSTHEPHLRVCVKVSTSSYIVSGSHHQSSKSRKEVAQKLAGVDAGGLVSAGAGKGVWISLVQRHGLRVCHSQITGMRYTHVQWFVYFTSIVFAVVVCVIVDTAE